MKSINPANGELIGEYPVWTEQQVTEQLQFSANAYKEWRETSFDSRKKMMLNLASGLKSDKEIYARLITNEMGKPISESTAEIEKCALVCEFYAERAEEFLQPVPVETSASHSYFRYDPLGPVLAVMPWNFPFWQVFRFLAPNLMAGNVGLLKHASNVQGCAIAIQQLTEEAGFPPHVWSTLPLKSSAIEKVIDSPHIKAVTLTGSEEAGRAVAGQAGKQIKKSVLELGGSDPFIVLADVDIDDVAAKAIKGRMQNTGQSCIAAKRFIVQTEIIKEFKDALVSRIESLKVGDPLDEATDIGPMARQDLREELHTQVEKSVQQGGVLVCGGKPLDRVGSYYAPTLLENIKPDNIAFQEEMFGPVAVLVEANDVDHAIQLANDSSFGLGGSLWTKNIELADKLVPRIESGAVFVNEIVKSDPRISFGGIKNSGYGRELGKPGIHEFVNVKTVWIA
ncbi:Succinate semialdehyde dehydrogenase [NAD(P)+] Sad [Polystyrenella longa]|uniref:Succinate semialdehyde dehydrogenase [NAD(P)+] Sad n=1 Tax=Polystyrenella longa TaxID=2528007 RepID=A0A518CPF5_9PLAN|nr:NAD-dependent succinate-semialdehyde dehydrogenase [Polystyrenella longa]QDU81117.1 Succinate semialdehyde dehydrogenase [NAD(P)+] Sad [Polystyrenella longa]